MLLWLRRKKRKLTELDKLIEKDFPALIKKLESQQFLSKMLLNKFGKEDEIVKRELGKLKEIEKQIIELLPDDFQKKVFNILSRNNVDFLEFLESDDWKKPLKDGYENIAFYLDPKRPLNIIRELGVSGKDFLFWMLEQAKTIRVRDGYKNIAEALKRKSVCGKNISTNERLQWQVSQTIVCVLFSDEYRLQFKVLMEIMCELEEGENFIKNELYNNVRL